MHGLFFADTIAHLCSKVLLHLQPHGGVTGLGVTFGKIKSHARPLTLLEGGERR